MFFSKTNILAVGALCNIFSAAPAPMAEPEPAAPIYQLDSNGQVEWTTTTSGARVAEIPFADVDTVGPSNKIKARGGTDSSVGSWTNLGQITNYAAQYACQDSGEWSLSTVVQSQAASACSELLEMVPGAPVADKAWHAWKDAPPKANDEGQNVKAIFRFFYKTSSSPKLTETLCTKAINTLTSTACQGKNDKSDSSRGGEIRIGSGDDYTQVGYDPGPPDA